MRYAIAMLLVLGSLIGTAQSLLQTTEFNLVMAGALKYTERDLGFGGELSLMTRDVDVGVTYTFHNATFDGYQKPNSITSTYHLIVVDGSFIHRFSDKLGAGLEMEVGMKTGTTLNDRRWENADRAMIMGGGHVEYAPVITEAWTLVLEGTIGAASQPWNDYLGVGVNAGLAVKTGHLFIRAGLEHRPWATSGSVTIGVLLPL